MFEAFKAGLIDYRVEDNVTRWRSEYDFPAAKDGRVVTAAIPNGLPKGVSGFAFNTRRRMFADARVREALAAHVRLRMDQRQSLRRRLQAVARVLRRQRALLDRPPGVRARTGAARPFPRRGARRRDGGALARADVRRHGARPRGGAPRHRRASRRAGYVLKDGRLVDARGTPLAFEITVKDREEERLALAYARNLARIGVAANVRLVDEVQFQRRRTRFDFDMMLGTWTASPSPGNEQRGRWGSASANAEGAYNIAGVASPAIDAMIAAMLAAKSSEDFVAAVRALDRVLISGFYIVPLYYAPEQWIAYSSKLGRPDVTPLFGVDLAAWWRREP